MTIFDKYDLRRLASDIYLSGVNLAEDRHDWIVLMRSMAGGGEALRESFLRLASQGSTYKERENQREFTKAVARSNDSSLAWFLKKAKDLGYNLDDYQRTLPVQPHPLYPPNSGGRNPSKGRGNKNYHRQAKRGSPPVLPQIHPATNSSLPMFTIPSEYIQKCRSNSSTFVQSLISTKILTQEQAERAADLYRLGAMKDGSVIYWQIDEQGRVRDGKIMLYGADCHRLKDHGAQWMGWMMRYKLRGADGKFLLPQDWQSTQCLFGQQLLSSKEKGEGKSEKLICVVEAEKTAVILSQLQPDKLWLATGGESQLTLDKLAALKGRKVILFPDTDPDGKTFINWQNIANEARRQLGLNISVSDLLEDFASPDQKQRKIDLADFLIESRDESQEEPQEETPPQEPVAHSDDPVMQDLIDTFDLVEVSNENYEL